MKEKIKCTIRYSVLALVTGVAVGAIDTIFGRGLFMAVRFQDSSLQISAAISSGCRTADRVDVSPVQ